MKTIAYKSSRPLALAVAAVLASWQVAAVAQDVPEPTLEEQDAAEGIEEVVVTGRFISSSQQLVNERMNDAFATDLLGADTIARLGDSTVGAALRRVPGLSLVQDKFVYIRGLGERYSQTTLNGATIPSPDLTRNVIPLNIFPTSIVESLRVQKSYSPELSANFGGGAVDIRTKGIPDAFTVKFEFGVGANSENPSNILTYPGGGDDNLGTDDGTRALSPVIRDALAQFQGNLSTNNILTTLQRTDPTATFFDAQLLNRQLAVELNRNVGIQNESVDPDYKGRVSVGSKFDFADDWQFGFAAGASYDSETRWRRTRSATFVRPDEQFGVREESTKSVNISGTLNFGLSFTEDHEIETASLFLRNTDDETEEFDFFNENAQASSGRGFRRYRLEFEEREMVTNQIKGTHYLGAATREAFPFLDIGLIPEEMKFDWFYTDSTAETDIPNRAEFALVTQNDPSTGEVITASHRLQTGAADYRFTDLEDEVENYGWSLLAPFDWGNNYIEVSGGYAHSQKARTYEQQQFTFGYLSVDPNAPNPVDLTGPINEVYGDVPILETIRDPDPTNPVPDAQVFVNSLQFNVLGSNQNSYLAATMTDGVWGKLDWTWKDTWRLAAGARWEDYRQVGLPWNPNGFDTLNPQITNDVDELESNSFNEDKVYPAVGLTYMGDLWAETFQVRLGYSQTAVRPDLREITLSSYVDPLTGDVTRGNPGIVPSELDNIDLRTEWYFGNGDNLTFTLFYKDITNPIEFFEIAASDTTIAREIINAESGETTGLEVEFLKELGFLGSFFDMFFIQGNFTVQDTELVAGTDADAPTNPVRELSGASEYMVNFMIGFDSADSKHTASLIFNTFGERLFVAGRNGAPDAFEQPFDSLDFTYFWYPTDRLTVKAKLQNILGSTIEIKRQDVVVFEEDPGTTYELALSWGF